MISSLTGRVDYVDLTKAVIDVGGVGYLISATPQTLSQLRIGENSRVYTALIVREDAMTLYGFTTTDERDVFVIMMGVSGIGPRTSLAVLATHEPEAVRVAVAQEDEKAFTKVPGIGPKGARRIVLELGGKLVPTGSNASESLPAVPPAERIWREKVIEGLMGLGWTERDADRALTATLKEDPSLADSADVSLILRATLRDLGQAQKKIGGAR